MNAEIRRAAWNLHRYEGMKGIVSLPAVIVGSILGRGVSKYQNMIFAVSSASDEVMCGTAVVWKTGGNTVCRYCLLATSDWDLDYMDYIEEFMWVKHVQSLQARGYVADPSHAPTSWRNGVQLSELARLKIIEQMNQVYGKLPAIEVKGR